MFTGTIRGACVCFVTVWCVFMTTMCVVCHDCVLCVGVCVSPCRKYVNSLPNAVSSLPASSAPYSSYTACIIPTQRERTGAGAVRKGELEMKRIGREREARGGCCGEWMEREEV